MLGTASPNGWIGGTDITTEGTFVWTDVTSFTYTNWMASEPGGTEAHDCIQMRFVDGEWDEFNCDKNKVSICKK